MKCKLATLFQCKNFKLDSCLIYTHTEGDKDRERERKKIEREKDRKRDLEWGGGQAGAISLSHWLTEKCTNLQGCKANCVVIY